MHAPAQPAHPGTHVVPWRTLFVVFAALVALTVATVAATWVDLGKLNLVVALAIATVKAMLVLLYFMHLRWDNRFNAVVFCTTILFAALFVSLTLLDSKTYQPELIPDYAPAITPRS
ncbi:MAG TPA: cytochrome C oxidase subunit IV family protein [Thermoanaerobaculaceae bacterium]|nr:cytochrome C oxidase subunit IV family protein [Thermoanaerobaculaceae bacterium]HRS15237.1 cytochrome C oxidase subunit IV family protein [Thermoanaerobaculaceae bacterium]